MGRRLDSMDCVWGSVDIPELNSKEILSEEELKAIRAKSMPCVHRNRRPTKPLKI